jgi:RNA polymerase sigma-32 factor
MVKLEKSKAQNSFNRVSKPKKASPKTKVLEAEVITNENDTTLNDSEEIIDLDDSKWVESVDTLSTEVGAINSVVEDIDEKFDEKIASEISRSTEKFSAKPGLVSVDPLSRYFSEMRKYPLLTREEEHELGKKAYEEDNLEARNHLVTSNLRLVVKIAMEYRRAYAQVLDLIQEGNAGLVQAVNRFNPYRGVKLSTYSAWWIRAYILKFLMDNKSLVRMGTTDAQRKLFFKLRSEAEKMYALTRRFDTKLLAENMGVKESEVIEMHQRLSKSDMSLDAPVSDDSDVREIDLISSGAQGFDTALETDELVQILRREVLEIEKDLNERDKYIFHGRIMSDEPITLQDVGDKFGITRERARQLESRIIQKIKDRMISFGVNKEL